MHGKIGENQRSDSMETTNQEPSLNALLKASEEIEQYLSNTDSQLVDNTERYKALLNAYVKLQITNTISSSRSKKTFEPRATQLISQAQVGFVNQLKKQTHATKREATRI